MNIEAESTLREQGNKPLGASFRDPSGFLFRSNGILYRQVNQIYRQNYDHLMDSGLYQSLIEAELLIPHQEADRQIAISELAYKVIQPEPLEFVSYPYEWSFSQLKDAALATLNIQKHALNFGMTLKDSSAYNVQFHKGKPILIDSLSFEIYQEGKPWVAYRQFCQHFLAPLSLMAHRDIRLGQLLRVYIDGIPLDLASEMLPWRTRLVFPLMLHIHMHAKSQQRYADKPIENTRQMNRVSFLGLIDSLESGIRGRKWTPAGTEWGEYYDLHNYTSSGLEHKQKLVQEFIDQARPANVWDLGANTGLFSRLASQAGIPTVAFDIDPAAVERNYLEIRHSSETHILPLVLDLTNPSPGIGWRNQERMSLQERGPAEMVLALALVHHLAISNNLPLDRLASFFHQVGKWLVIEFVPKSDSQVKRLLSTREDIFPDYTQDQFERVFSERFVIHKKEPVQDSERCLYLMEGKQD